jgi:hypothetical protein
VLTADQFLSDSVRLAAAVRRDLSRACGINMPVTGSSASAYGAFSRNDIKKIEYFFPTP